MSASPSEENRGDRRPELSANASEPRADSRSAPSAGQCREVFQMFERGAGWILTKDLGPALRALGQIPSDHEIDMIASKLEQEELYDKGHTKLNFDQFHQVVLENSERKTDIREMVLDSFKSLDPDSTGTVEATKLTSLLTSMGEILSPSDMKELLQDAAVTKGGQIDYVKFVDSVLAVNVTMSDGTKGEKEAKA